MSSQPKVTYIHKRTRDELPFKNQNFSKKIKCILKVRKSHNIKPLKKSNEDRPDVKRQSDYFWNCIALIEIMCLPSCIMAGDEGMRLERNHFV